MFNHNHRLSLYWRLSVVVALLGTSCSGEKATADCFYVEIAPAKFVPVRFPYFKDHDLVIKYNGQVLTYKGPAGVNMAESLMEFDGKLYVLAFDARARRYEDRKDYGPWRWRCFEQDGDGFKEIPAADFPRSIAIINIWRPDGFRNHTSRRYRTGTKDGTIDQIDLVRSLDTENVHFANSDTAWLWFMLEVNNDFDAISGGGPRDTVRYDSSDRTFVRQFKAKYMPMQLTHVELRPVPKGECDF